MRALRIGAAATLMLAAISVTTSASSRAVDATVLAQDGKKVKLSSFWRSGKALIVFYRGHW